MSLQEGQLADLPSGDGGCADIAVCTANICRSPSTAALLRRGLAGVLPEATVTSGGVAAEPDRPACSVSAALAASAVGGLRAGDAERTNDELALDRSHRSEITRMHAAGRPKTFTLRQAAAAATLISADLPAGHVPEGSPAHARERRPPLLLVGGGT